MEQVIDGVNVIVEEENGPVNTITEEAPVETTTNSPVADGEPKKLVVDPKMYVYFDCEFTGLYREAQLLSIGLCDAEGHSFYAEFTDYDMQQVSEWVFKNVLQKMSNPTTVLEGDHWQIKGNTKEIRQSLLIWLDYVHKHSQAGIQFVSDCCHYDMVFLIDLLWKSALDMPEWIAPVAVDINMDLSNLCKNNADETNKSVPDTAENYAFNPYFEAFNLDRDEFASHISNAPKGLKHNSMYDAYVIRAIHQFTWQYNIEPTPLVTEG